MIIAKEKAEGKKNQLFFKLSLGKYYVNII